MQELSSSTSATSQRSPMHLSSLGSGGGGDAGTLPTTPTTSSAPVSALTALTPKSPNNNATNNNHLHLQQQQHQSIHSSSSSSSKSTANSAENDGDAPSTNGRLLWDFLQQLLNDPGQRYTAYIQWKNKDTGVFKIVDPAGLARLWGIQKNHLSMNYDKMSRALRYYYRVNILRKVQGERHCYQFLRNPSELKSIKNISLLRQQMEAQAAAQQLVAQQAAALHSSPGVTATSPPTAVATAPSIKTETDNGANNSMAMDDESVHGGGPVSPPHSDEPTDLTTSGSRGGREEREREERERERQERERYYSQLMERYNIERSSPSRDRSDDREESRSHFDYRHLIPQVSIKTE